MKPAFYLGLDGGGTGCRARLRGTDGALLGEGTGGPANIRLGLDVAWHNMLDAIDGALGQAGLRRDALDRVAAGLGLAGIMDSSEADRTVAAGPAFAAARAVSDAHIACLGAFGGRDGAILIAGTGSAAHMILEGRAMPMFGWGFEVDDKGSAASLGRAAVAASLDGRDGLGPATPLTSAILEKLGSAPAEIVKWTTQARPRDYGTLAPLAIAHAERGDAVALRLVRKTAEEIEAMLGRLVAIGAPRLCLIGGMAAPITPWLSPWARAALSDREQDPVEGAILMMREEGGNGG